MNRITKLNVTWKGIDTEKIPNIDRSIDEGYDVLTKINDILREEGLQSGNSGPVNARNLDIDVTSSKLDIKDTKKFEELTDSIKGKLIDLGVSSPIVQFSTKLGGNNS